MLLFVIMIKLVIYFAKSMQYIISIDVKSVWCKSCKLTVSQDAVLLSISRNAELQFILQDNNLYRPVTAASTEALARC